MSRIGRLPIAVPAGVTVDIAEGNVVTVKGPKGTLVRKIHSDITINQENGVLTLTRPSDNKNHRALHGLSRALVNDMVIGVTTGFSKALELVGVGYRAAATASELTLEIGFSHPVKFAAANGISFETPVPTRIVVHGIDKQAVGQIAADIRKVRPPEPYLGKGIKYEGEHILRKEGKTGK